MLRTMLALAALLFPLLLSEPAQAAALSVWVQNESDRAFSSSAPPSGAPSSVALYAARNEYQAAQILVRSASAQTGVSVSFGALSGPGTPITDITARKEYNHPNIAKVGSDYQNPPDGGSAYFDALVDNTPQSLAANTTLAYFYQVHVPAGQTPGVYTGSAVVHSDSGNVSVPVSVAVYNVTIPPANQSSFKMNNWFTSAGWDYSGTQMSIPVQYGVSMYDANWWKVIGNFAVNQAKHRNNVIYADFQALLIPGTTVDSSGTYTWDWSNFDRFVQLFVDAGAMQYIYTPTLIEGNPDGNTPGLEMLVASNGVSGPVKRVLAAPNTTTTNGYLDKVFPALKAHLDAKGWTDKFYMSALDEPSTTAQVNAANWLYTKYKAYFPNARTNEAHASLFPGNEANLTTLTPYTGTYDANIAHYQSQRLAGKDLWLYTCIVPQDGHMNRFVSYALDGTRLLPWLVWKVGGDGYLHWGWNYWGNLGDGSNFGNVNTFDDWQTGDNWLVRPNKPAYDVYDSLRSEAQLDGQQDFELLNLLKAAKPITARQITESLITNGTSYDHSGADVVERHKQILDELVSTTPDMSFPFVDSFDGTENAWRHTKGTWSVNAGEYVQSDTSDWGFASAVEGRTYGDVAASVDLKITGVLAGGGNSNWAGLMIHSLNPTDMDSGYLVAQRNDGRVFLYRNGTTLAQATAPGYVPGAWNHLRVIYQQGAIKVFSGGDQVLSVTDNAFPLGSVAVVTGGASARFDNVHLNPLVNAAEFGTVTASSSYQGDGWSLAAANDGLRTSWSNAMGWSSVDNMTTNHTEWVKVDLGSTRSISRVDLYPRNDGASTGLGFPVDFTVQVSANGTSWTTVASPTGYARPSADPQTFPFAPVNARYVKVTGTNLRTDNLGHYHMQFAEIETAGGDLALGRTVTSSSSVEYPAESWLRYDATDGVRLSQLWYSMGFSSALASSQHTEWVQVDLGGPSRVSKVVLWPRSDGANTGNGFPVDFTVQVSPDGTNWTTVASRTGYQKPGATGQEFGFSPVTARYVRTTGTQLDPSYLLQFAEIEVF
ncbi:discoidin domain-containing protein [Nonomuraea sediminis]|uniref:discoidin domain-containing protein n=1 Tax=Nonomuraea sediminis TaxID=2835864 RepID=UPI001BDD8C2E|nr:discoidin domain-containing protein [Nonomuraea sediminis]